MPTTTRTFRIFVSSTFEDLKAERNALQRDVFPKLRALCERHGARFQAIDLRWGVRDEAALDQKTMEICLREIQRCQATGVRPNFIVLLGDRYGWQPLPARIPAAEFDPRPVAGDWYKLDENADPPEYVLQPRTGIFTNPDIWGLMEQTLHPRLEAAARASGISGKPLSKYVDSATHQEILAGLGGSEEERRHVFGFFRRPSTGTDPRLAAVKALVPNRTEFAPGDAAALSDAVYSRLARIIEEQARSFEDRPPCEAEIAAHDRFAAERARIFQGRRRELDAIADYLRGGERRPLVLHGASGSGKSALMAKASLACPGRVLRRFIGATPASASGHALVTGLCLEMAQDTETPVDFVQLAQAFQERLAAAGPLVLFLDALDQLADDDPARDLSWLPPELPPGVKVVLSTTLVELSSACQLEIQPMTRAEGADALDDWLRDAGREPRQLQPWQRAKVLDGFARCGLPLYLKLAAEESRLWPSYAADAECRVGEGVEGMLDALFARLAGEAGHGPVLVSRGLGYLAAARHGLTEDEVLEVLAADDAVWEDFDRHKHHEVEGRQLPVVVWSRLRLDLDPYLSERAAPGGTVIAFYHRQLAERAAADQEARHADLARYFGAKPAWFDAERKRPNARRAAELPFQQRGARDWPSAEATLFDCQFLLSKCAAGLVVDLEADYRPVLAEKPGEALRLVHGALVLSMHVLARAPGQYASQMVGRLLGLTEQAGVVRFVEDLAVAAPGPWIRPLHACFDAPGGPLLRTLEGHSYGVSGVAVAPDGGRAVSACGDHTLKVWDLETGRALRTLEGHSNWVSGMAVMPDGRRAVSASWDSTLKVWDLETGRDLRTLEGHSKSVDGVAVTPDGRRAVSASDDHTLKVWDLETGRALRTLEGHSNAVTGVAVTPDGRAVSTSSDHTLKVWDLETGRALRTLEGHSDEVFGVAVTPDGRRAVSASGDHTLKVWDLETGRALRTLEGHSNRVSGVAVTSDGRRAVSASWDHTLKVWDLETGRALRTLEGHADPLSGVAVTPDGRRAVSASWDHTLKVWGLETGRALRALEGHSEAVNGVAVTPDGRRAVSASHDKTLKVWDLETGRALRTLEGHSDLVNGVAVTPDGRRVVSASYDTMLKVWDLETGRALRTLEGHSEWVSGVAVTPDGRRAVSASWDHTLKVWELETGRVLRTLEGHSNWVFGVAVTPDGRRAVSASGDKTLKVWDLETGRALRTLEGHSEEVYGVAVTPDGRRAVSASWDHTLKVWDLETGRALRTLEGHSDWVRGVAVTPDGRRAVSASRDHTLKVWDLESGAVSATFYCNDDALCCACTSPNLIVAGDGGGRVYFLAVEE